ncbi:pentapeptide repeat protein [Thalassoporum mexicanum PCC 7367]|uniref:pentapeptide repeat-containing protein n=1 Tax=Thalassoporum mexicanum TaxID=3457544 RepID=UPI00029FCE9C|nr:pentapeptide repeat-containing protein [Pseudanabaena sp. PCC 7367]AFY68944.1 pentapeptide repeat protein [Pseudanabaena sp. PCC 7367]
MKKLSVLEIEEKLKQHEIWLKSFGANGQRFDVQNADLSGVDLQGVNLTDATLSSSDLSGANLHRAKLENTNLYFTNFSAANLSNVDFFCAAGYFANFDGANLSKAYLYQGGFFSADFSGADLCDADLSCTQLHEADFWGADLRGTELSGSNASGARFYKACLTGACIQGWTIDEETRFDQVDCEFVYLTWSGWDEEAQESIYFLDRLPKNENEFFKPGEFAVLVQQYTNTINLFFSEENGIDWQALSIALENFKAANNGQGLEIQGIEQQINGFIVKFMTQIDPTKPWISPRDCKTWTMLKEKYEEALQAIDTNYKEQLELTGDQLVFFKEQLAIERRNSTDFKGILKAMSNQQSSKYDLRGAQIGNLADTVKDNARQQTNQYNYAPAQKQTLAEAAAEIQQLLDQLAANNPTETVTDRAIVASKAIEVIEKNPTQKEKIVKALRVGGIAALKQMVKPVSEPITNVLFPMLEELTKN